MDAPPPALWILYSAIVILAAARSPESEPPAPPFPRAGSDEEQLAWATQRMMAESYRDTSLWITCDSGTCFEIVIYRMDHEEEEDCVFVGYLGATEADDEIEAYEPGPWCTHFQQLAARAAAIVQHRFDTDEGEARG
jgi:hypothetical protein